MIGDKHVKVVLRQKYQVSGTGKGYPRGISQQLLDQ